MFRRSALIALTVLAFLTLAVNLGPKVPSALAQSSFDYGTVRFSVSNPGQVDHEYCVWQANHTDLEVTGVMPITQYGNFDGFIIFYRRAKD